MGESHAPPCTKLSGVTLGAYLRVLAVYVLSEEIDHIAADDALGRRIQDLALLPTLLVLFEPFIYQWRVAIQP